MPTKPKKKVKPVTAVVREAPKNLPVALNAAKQFSEMLGAIKARVPTMPTDKLTELVAAMKPAEKTVADMNAAARKELINRVQEDDPHFLRVGNNSVVDVGDLTVTFRKNEKVVEIAGGIKWLRLHHPSQFAILTKREIRVVDAVAVDQVASDLTELLRTAPKGRIRVEDIQPLLAQLHSTIEKTDRLDQKAVEKAVKAGTLTEDDAKQLYQLEGEGDPTYSPSFTMTVAPKKELADGD